VLAILPKDQHSFRYSNDHNVHAGRQSFDFLAVEAEHELIWFEIIQQSQGAIPFITKSCEVWKSGSLRCFSRTFSSCLYWLWTEYANTLLQQETTSRFVTIDYQSPMAHKSRKVVSCVDLKKKLTCNLLREKLSHLLPIFGTTACPFLAIRHSVE
jgi:hypothetical protein